MNAEVNKDVDERIQKLKRICDIVVKDGSLWPRDGKTFCNFSVNLICSHMGYTGFKGMVANEIYDFCLKNHQVLASNWVEEYALGGGLAVAAQRGDPHGHVAVVAPHEGVFSGKWRKRVPIIANVGLTCGLMGVNYGFKTEPTYFAIPL